MMPMNSSLSLYKKELEDELKRVVGIFISQYKPNKIILFGSLAKNSITENSDIDLLIVKDTEKRYWDRIDEVFHLVHPVESMDIFVLTRKEIDENVRKNNVYLKEILEEGKILYEGSNR